MKRKAVFRKAAEGEKPGKEEELLRADPKHQNSVYFAGIWKYKDVGIPPCKDKNNFKWV